MGSTEREMIRDAVKGLWLVTQITVYSVLGMCCRRGGRRRAFFLMKAIKLDDQVRELTRRSGRRQDDREALR